ncbi:MAG TPA: hypothetical protein VFC33_18580 [Acidimicrobiia bacterium]|nr:hypothetical protein [Acidimicrobiia bacterium]
MRRGRIRAAVESALVPLLEPGEEPRASAAVWMADRRARVPLLVTSRAVYLLALTDRRLLVFDTPRRGRPLLEADLLLAKPLGAFTLRSVAAWHPLLQLRVGLGRSRELVLEFRPRDRAVGHAVADALPRAPREDARAAADVSTA